MKRIIAFLIAAVMMFGFSACSSQETTPKDTADSIVKTELIMGYTTEPEGLDPHRTAAASTFTTL